MPTTHTNGSSRIITNAARASMSRAATRRWAKVRLQARREAAAEAMHETLKTVEAYMDDREFAKSALAREVLKLVRSALALMEGE